MEDESYIHLQSLDAIYLDVSDNENVVVFDTGVNADVGLKSWIVNPLVGYQIVDSDSFQIEAIAGVRYLWLETTVKLRNADPSATNFNVNVSEDGRNWNAVIGLRGELPFASNWFIPYQFDIGAGDSEFTWQGYAGIGYRFEVLDLAVGYRYLS